MSYIEIKSQIHLLVDRVEDIFQLQNILSFISQDNDILNDLSPKQQNELFKTLEEFPKGNFTSNEQMKIEARQWLTR